MRNIEIERKFLLKNDSWRQMMVRAMRIVQGYLSQDPDRTIRVRRKDKEAYLTIKSRPNDWGWSRYEFEKRISMKDAEELFQLCLPSVIDKIRYHVPCGDVLVEVDEFLGDNYGLILAEIELTSENQSFEKPDFLGKEVTGDARYYNVMLAQHPYKKWKKEDESPIK